MIAIVKGYYRDHYCDELYGEDDNYTITDRDFVITIPDDMKYEEVCQYILSNDDVKQNLCEQMIEQGELDNLTETKKWKWTFNEGWNNKYRISIIEQYEDTSECIFFFIIEDIGVYKNIVVTRFPFVAPETIEFPYFFSNKPKEKLYEDILNDNDIKEKIYNKSAKIFPVFIHLKNFINDYDWCLESPGIVLHSNVENYIHLKNAKEFSIEIKD